MEATAADISRALTEQGFEVMVLPDPLITLTARGHFVH
jgi:hypothetical protein